MTQSKVAVAVFVKTAGLSPLKTRLASSIGAQAATEFHTLCCQNIGKELHLLSTLRPEVKAFWAVAEADHPLHKKAWNSLPTVYQGEGALGERLNSVFQRLHLQADQVILLGADAPHLNFKELIGAVIDSKDPISIGPAEDGGFYLFSSRLPIDREIWTEVSYSSKTTLEDLTDRLRSRDLQVQFLHRNFDVDTWEDLQKLERHLRQHQPDSELARGVTSICSKRLEDIATQ